MAQPGRPRTFDREQAIEQALLLFWQYGYESTSLALLKESIAGGITAPSFYAAFGSKEALFKEVVERYIRTYGQVNQSLWDKTLSAKQAIETTLRCSAKMQTENSHPKGCLLVLSANTCPPEHQAIMQLLANKRAHYRRGFLACVKRAILQGELPSSTDATGQATLLYSFYLGLTMQARDGVTCAVLEAAISKLMRIWR